MITNYNNKLERYIPILMSASVSTRGMACASFTDQQREQMYLGALKFYERTILKNQNQKIVFVDNSGWDLTFIKSQISLEYIGQIEFLSFDPNEFDISKGKGYNELLMINKALAASAYIKETGCFFKVTGRYPIYNLQYFLDQASRAIFDMKLDLYGDMKDHSLFDFLHLGWNGHAGEAKLFGTTVEWYTKNLGCRYSELNDYQDRLVENLMFEVMKRSDNIVKRFKREPYMGGAEGSNNNTIAFTKDQDSFMGKMKRFAGNFIRTCLPFFWF